MTANGVAFALAGSPNLYEGQIVGLEGSQIAARVTTPGGSGLELQIALNYPARANPGHRDRAR